MIFDMTKRSGANLQTKSVSFTGNGTERVAADRPYDGLSELIVTIAVPQGAIGVQSGTITGKSTGSEAKDYEIDITGDVTHFALAAPCAGGGDEASPIPYAVQCGIAYKPSGGNEGQLYCVKISGSGSYAVLNNANEKVKFETGKLTVYTALNQATLHLGIVYRWFAW